MSPPSGVTNERGKGLTTLNRIVSFLLNTASVALVFALVGSVAWPIVRKLVGIPSWRASTDILLILAAAMVFIVIRDYRDIL